MSKTSQIVNDSIAKIAQTKLNQLNYNTKSIIKLKAIIAANEHGVSNVAKVFNVTDKTILSWTKKLKADPDGFLNIRAGRGRKTKLNQSQIKTIQAMIINNPQLSIKEVQNEIERGFGIRLGTTTVYYIMQKNIPTCN